LEGFKSPIARRKSRMSDARRRSMKRSELVALQIVEDIVARGMVAGDKLPLEAEMLVEYHVSRSSLREALRLLDVQGLITIRPGPGGGTEVGQIDPANLSGTLNLYLLMGRATLSDLLDAWLMVEPLLAQLAAKSKDREKVERMLRGFASDATTSQRELAAGLAFHDAVAELGQNQLLSLLLGAVGFLVTEQVRIGAPGFNLSSATIYAHKEIAEAILDGDEARAYASMRDHLHEVKSEIEAVLPTTSRKFLFAR
jgi:DNA-binding FadR family transcriptional regulator